MYFLKNFDKLTCCPRSLYCYIQLVVCAFQRNRSIYVLRDLALRLFDEELHLQLQRRLLPVDFFSAHRQCRR